MAAAVDTARNVYIFLHGRMDLRKKAEEALASRGFASDKMVLARPSSVGRQGEYMAMLWMPPNPDHIKIQLITDVRPVEPEGMMGLWKGVTSNTIDTVPLVS